MATADIQNKKEELTTCSICFETFRVPKHFPCLHSFCEKCVNAYISSTFQEGHTVNGVTCPVCRVFVKKPNEVSVEDWAESLPVNHLMVSLIDISESQSDTKLCNACAREKETENAEFWCVNCGEALCKQCVRHHRKYKMSASHKITDIDSASESLQYADLFCSAHPGKSLEVYCDDHSVVCCMDCVMLKHRKCDDVESTEEAAQSMKRSDKVTNIEKTLKATKGVLETLVQSRIDNMTRNLTTLGDVKTDVEKLFQEVLNHIDQVRANLLLEISIAEKEIQLQLENERDELLCKVSAAEIALAFYYSHMNCAPPAQFLQAMERLSEQSRDLRKFAKNQMKILKDTEVQFERNKSFKAITDINQIGELKIEKNKLKNIGMGIDMLTVVPRLVAEKDVEDTVQGLAILNNDRMLVSKHKGRCVELWDNECNELSCLSVSGHPYGIKMISDTEGMVAVESSMLTVFTIQNKKIMTTKDIKVPIYLDFVFHAGEYYIGCINKIVVHDSSHQYMRSINVSGNVGWLAARDEHTLCYTLYPGHTMHCITLDGETVFTYSHDKLKDTRGVTVDDSGYIYVCDYSSMNVHQLSHDGKLMRIILDDIPTMPYCIEFNDNGDKAVVVGNSKVLVYELK